MAEIIIVAVSAGLSVTSIMLSISAEHTARQALEIQKRLSK